MNPVFWRSNSNYLFRLDSRLFSTNQSLSDWLILLARLKTSLVESSHKKLHSFLDIFTTSKPIFIIHRGLYYLSISKYLLTLFVMFLYGNVDLSERSLSGLISINYKIVYSLSIRCLPMWFLQLQQNYLFESGTHLQRLCMSDMISKTVTN